MDILEMLGVALGLATLAGVNLYLTVLATGLSLHLKWVVLPASMDQLNALADPWVIGISAILYILEFFADKVPWIDSLNDSVHTVIRPLGGATLAVLAMGDAVPAVKVIAALLAGGAALTSHVTKAGTRLVVNSSPEPISNIGLSLGEDAIVLGGLSLLALHPIIAGGLAVLVLLILWIILPGLIRALRANAWLAWRKLNNPADNLRPRTGRLPANLELALRRAHATTAEIATAVYCLSDGGPRLPRNHLGWLVHFSEEIQSVFFVAPRMRGPLIVEIPTGKDITSERKSKFMCEALILSGEGTWKFQFERGHAFEADRFAASLKVNSNQKSLSEKSGDSPTKDVPLEV